jgi:hypothetical protein
MPKVNAPAVSLETLIDQRYALDEQLEKLKAAREALGDQIVKEMKALKIRTAYGSTGRGYRMDSWMQIDFAPKVLEYIRRIKKTALFISEPKVTNARLRDAFQGGHITAAQHDRIMSHGGKPYPVSRLVSVEASEK